MANSRGLQQKQSQIQMAANTPTFSL
jgi:hypothetical protein